MFKKILSAVFVSLAFANAFAFDKTYSLTVAEFEDLQISENGIAINNFSLGERRAFLLKDAVNVEVSFSVRNRNEEPKALNVMIVGMSGEKILWALEAAPGMSTISGKKTEDARADAYVPAGTVKQTSRIWLRVVGNF